jgi:hypothetical protein
MWLGLPLETQQMLSQQGITDRKILAEVLADPIAAAELARHLKAGPFIKLRQWMSKHTNTPALSQAQNHQKHENTKGP